jgi:hypothetical protein
MKGLDKGGQGPTSGCRAEEEEEEELACGSLDSSMFHGKQCGSCVRIYL